MQLLTKAVYMALLSLLLATDAAASAQPEAVERMQQATTQVAEPQSPTEPEAASEAAPARLAGAEQAEATDERAAPAGITEPDVMPESSQPAVTKSEPRQSLPFQRQDPPAERSPNSGISLGKIAISLAAVLLLVVALGWLFKKLTLRLPGSQHVKVICSVPLGQRERLLVVEIQGKQRVLGVTPQSINMLFELENSLPETKLASDFHTQLQSFLKK